MLGSLLIPRFLYSHAMFVLTVERVFSAAHQVRLGGVMEPLHSHDWRVRASVVGERLDRDGLLIDFHLLELALDRIIAPWCGNNLNDRAPFTDAYLPTAEHVAQHIATSLAPEVPAAAQLGRVSVTEAPGCEATYIAAPSGAFS